jgi:hypothetical protein
MKPPTYGLGTAQSFVGSAATVRLPLAILERKRGLHGFGASFADPFNPQQPRAYNAAVQSEYARLAGMSQAALTVTSLRPRLTPPQRRTLHHALANSIDGVVPTTY